MTDRPLFLDTSYILALYNTRDQRHSKALECQQMILPATHKLVTTEFVLMEVGNSLCSRNFREDAGRIIRSFKTSRTIELISADSALFLRGLELYEHRNDKDWGLTDCTSFVVMRERDLSIALSTDAHFVQAGFRSLLLE